MTETNNFNSSHRIRKWGCLSCYSAIILLRNFKHSHYFLSSNTANTRGKFVYLVNECKFCKSSSGRPYFQCPITFQRRSSCQYFLRDGMLTAMQYPDFPSIQITHYELFFFGFINPLPKISILTRLVILWQLCIHTEKPHK